jgi:hypothetical protein
LAQKEQRNFAEVVQSDGDLEGKVIVGDRLNGSIEFIGRTSLCKGLSEFLRGAFRRPVLLGIAHGKFKETIVRW